MKLIKKLGKAIEKYNLIEDSDTIAVGMSGGKDSYTLLDLLVQNRRYVPIDYEIIAVHIDYGYSEEQTENIKAFCKARDIKCYIEKRDLVIEKGKEINCFWCSWVRRAEIFKFIGKLKIKKLAFAHHANDIAETLLMNMFYQSKFEAFYPKTTFFKGEFELIRPLILCTDSEIREYADIKNFPHKIHKCPFNIQSERMGIRDILNKYTEKDKRIITNILTSWLKNI